MYLLQKNKIFNNNVFDQFFVFGILSTIINKNLLRVSR